MAATLGSKTPRFEAAALFWRRKKTFRIHWKGGAVEVAVHEGLDDARTFDRDLRLVASNARTVAQLARDVNDLAQENGLVLHVDEMTDARLRVQLRPLP